MSVDYLYLTGTGTITPTYPGEVTAYSKVFHYDQSGRLVAETNSKTLHNVGSERTEIVYLYDEGNMIGFVYILGETSNTYYYLRNLQGDVIAIYDTVGVKVAEYAYDAFGNCTITSTTNSIIAHANPIRYRGYYYDEDTGLYYLNSRYYNPEWRRFISPDSTEYIDSENPNGLNLYAYCYNDPINYADPTGHAPWWSWAISGFQLIAGIALCFVPGAQGLGVGMIAGGALGLIANVAFPAIAQAIGGASSISNGWGAFSTGISLLSFGTPGVIAGICMMVVGGVTMAFGANEIIAAISGTNCIQTLFGMSDSAYGWTYFGLNVASSIGTSVGRWGMRIKATSIYNNTGEIKPYASVSMETKIEYYNGKGKRSWSIHLTNHGHPKEHKYVPHWHAEMPHYPKGGFEKQYQLFWELVLRSFGGGHK